MTDDVASVVSDACTEESDTAVYLGAVDPKKELLQSLATTSIAKQCIRQGIYSKSDERFHYIIERYGTKCPGLRDDMVEQRIQELVNKKSNTTNVSSKSDGDALESSASSDNNDEDIQSNSGCWSSFKSKMNENRGTNLLTYTFLQLLFAILMFIISVIITHTNYNRSPYRNWALAGGVTSTSAEFRVRGPEANDNLRREFVVSPNSNLGIEKDQILNVPVSYTDYSEDEHFVKKLSIDSLEPLTTYYYAITQPQVVPNSVTIVDGNIGSFKTPAPEGSRMNFTVALGSCSLTGSRSSIFESILELDPQLFINMGDFHYEDLVTLNIEKRLEAYDKVLGSSSQRSLYMGTIFSYIWDDHDWLANNDDGSNVDAGNIAKQGYSLGIPHYSLASLQTQTSTDEGTAAKYQAFTIGTVRFIILDLRSESRKSTNSFSGKVYSDEQKQWLFSELSKADNYDYVVLANSRPWTSPDEIGSDSWGGFVSDRNELSSFIASTIGAGPKNLFVISGDNHMIAFDDGSNTDFSGQTEFPAGFPLLHAGPLSKYGAGNVKNIFKPKDYRFTDGCMAISAETNYQFSTIEFDFPQDAAKSGCLRIKGYRNGSSSGNIVFEKELCGKLMTDRSSKQEQETCQLKSFTLPNTMMLMIALALVMVQGVLVVYFLGKKRWDLALSYFGIGILFYGITIAASLVGALCFGVTQVNTLAVSALLLCQTAIGFAFVCIAVHRYRSSINDYKDEDIPEKIASVSEDAVSKESFRAPTKYGYQHLEDEIQTEVVVQADEPKEIEVIL